MSSPTRGVEFTRTAGLDEAGARAEAVYCAGGLSVDSVTKLLEGRGLSMYQRVTEEVFTLSITG